MNNDYQDCLTYIDTYWDKIIHRPSRKVVNQNIITIPYSYFTPNDKKFNYFFYWDSFFMFKGLVGTRHEWVMKHMVENFAYLFYHYGLIPNFNAPASMGRSQPPFLSSMILDVYDTAMHGNLLSEPVLSYFSRWLKKSVVSTHWLEKMIRVAKNEYNSVWIDTNNLFHHRVEGYGLSRYGDRDLGYAHSSELESGWDFTSRFYNRCNEFLPIDLNSYLYKYEKDFELVASLLGKTKEVNFWIDKAQKRKKMMDKLFWNQEKGFFFDYDYVNKKQSPFYSLAGFVPLWTGAASLKQSKQIVEKLFLFETEYGLVITAADSLSPKINLSKIPVRFRSIIKEVIKPKQWDYPNIWPPLEYLTVTGLLRYGFLSNARRIMEKSVNAHAKIFRKYGTFFERIDGKLGDKPKKEAHYKIQSGFGWTNAIFYRYIKILQDLEDGVDIYGFSKEENPPYDLNILN